jgi:spore coat polysaccharide biosynthesis protein SpsF (cytidylyltransferase family)
VLARYYQTALKYGEGNDFGVVRVTGDCPVIDPALVDEVVDAFLASGVDYCSNTLTPTYPDGLARSLKNDMRSKG